MHLASLIDSTFSNIDVRPLISTIIAVAIFAAIAAVGLWRFGVERPTAPLTAILRAVVQLAALSVVLAGIIRDPLWVAVGLVVMFVAAVITAARRTKATRREAMAIALGMFVANVTVLTIVFATGALEFSPRYVLAIGGIVIGNTMTIASLTGRLFRSSVFDHWDEVEGWLALGATPWESTVALARTSLYSALVPSIDQTRTTGIVVLPGAFVGAIFGGASPVEAGRFQIVVLAGILAAGVLTGAILLRLAGGVAMKPVSDTTASRR
jgi:putative ABC transport system permease protein